MEFDDIVYFRGKSHACAQNERLGYLLQNGLSDSFLLCLTSPEMSKFCRTSPPHPPPQHSQVKRNRCLVKLWVQWRNKMASRPANRKLDSYNKVVVKNLNIYMKWTLIVWPFLRTERGNNETFLNTAQFLPFLTFLSLIKNILSSSLSSRTHFWQLGDYCVCTYVMYLQFKFKNILLN